MQIDINTTVEYEIAKVQISAIAIINAPIGLIVSIPYVWLDSSGKIIRTGVNQYTEAQLSQSITLAGATIEPYKKAFQRLYKAGLRQVLHMVIPVSKPAYGTSSAVVDASYVSERKTEAQINEAFEAEGVTLAQLKNIISIITNHVITQ